MMQERTNLEAEVEYLVEEIGLERAEAERVMEDEDLWMLDPEQRHAFLDPEEEVRQWEMAYSFAEGLAYGLGDARALNDATAQLLWEMREKARETLRRARRRRHPEMRNTVFGEVLTELLERRRLPVTPFHVGKLAEDAGLNGWKVINRMARADAKDFGPLDTLAAALDLTEPEKEELARAYSMERRVSAQD